MRLTASSPHAVAAILLAPLDGIQVAVTRRPLGPGTRAPGTDPHEGGYPERITYRAALAVFAKRAVALRAHTPELEVLGRQNPVPQAERRASQQPAGEHPIAQNGCRLPDSRLDAGIAAGILGAEAGFPAAK